MRHHELARISQVNPAPVRHIGRVAAGPESPGFRKCSARTGYCFFFGFGIVAMESVGVRALDLEIRFRRLSERLSPPLCFSSIFNQSGMTIARINSCTVISLSSAIFRSFVKAESPRDCMNLDDPVASNEYCCYYQPEPLSPLEQSGAI